MIKNRTISIILPLVICLVFPNRAVFAFQDFSASSNNSGQVFTGAKTVLMVSQAKTSRPIETAVIQNKKLNCQFFEGKIVNFVQNASGINLNQPADCLPINPNGVELKYSALSVVPLMQNLPQIKVLNNAPASLGSKFATFPEKQDMPILPVNAAVLVLSFILLVTKQEGFKFSSKLSQISYKLNLHQLQVMRC